jgi:pyridoxamine 5'-phosphate oxidase
VTVADTVAARLARLRREYAASGLSPDDLDPDPVAQFGEWLHAAVEAGITEPNAMTLATADASGAPSARTVLLKGYDHRGFVFFTNYGSRKARELADNPRAALTFAWVQIHRQVVVTGGVRKVARTESAAYFATRPRGAQLSAWASPQSELVPDRDTLDRALAGLEERYAGRDVPCPPHWGGLRVVPDTVEFWQGRADRLHDRLRYRRTARGWVIERLAP